jgi:hypothetical protein
MSDERFLGEPLPSQPKPCVTDSVTDSPCCLCDQYIGMEAYTYQSFETDPEGRLYRAHAKCAHEYGLAMRAFRAAVDTVTPTF